MSTISEAHIRALNRGILDAVLREDDPFLRERANNSNHVTSTQDSGVNSRLTPIVFMCQSREILPAFRNAFVSHGSRSFDGPLHPGNSGG